MGLFTSLAVSLSLFRLGMPVVPRPKRPRGRPRKPEPSWLGATYPPKRKRGGQVRHAVSDTWLIDTVDSFKLTAIADGRPPISDQRALVELLLAGAPDDVRARILEARAAYETRHAKTPLGRYRALRQAVLDVEGDRFEWWVKRLSEARGRSKPRL